MTRRGEGHLFPVGEYPEARTHLQERLEGKQISGVYWQPGAPPGWASAGLEFTTSEALLILACPTVDPMQPWRARLAFRWVEGERLWTPSMDRRYRLGQDRAQPEDFMQRQLQGQMIRGVVSIAEPTPEAGEQMRWEFSGGDGIHLVAIPGAGFTADLDLRFLPKGRRVLTLPGGQPTDWPRAA